MGGGKHEQREVQFLGRSISWTPHELEYESGEKHVNILHKELEMDNTKPVSTPGVSDEKADLGKINEE